MVTSITEGIVVDLPARRNAAEIFRRFIGGQITNDHFLDRLPDTNDPAIGVVWDATWSFYCDFREHKLTARDRLHPDTRRACIRWLLFLDSDLPYQWPPIHQPHANPIEGAGSGMSAMIRRWVGKDEQPSQTDKFANAGHYPVWPFISQKDYRAALRHPKRLNGKANQ